MKAKLIAGLAFVTDRFLLLPLGVLVALAWANTDGESYFRFAHALRFPVNDIGMVFFVGLVTEEVLESLMPGGALYHWRRTLLPVVAAIGGVLGATAVYVFSVQSQYEFMLLDGWPVAAAQDIAFAYFIAKFIFPRRRGPVAFLMFVAIVTNALALVNIAFWFPTGSSYPAAVVLMAVAVLVAALLRSRGIDRIWLYLATAGTLSWLACYGVAFNPRLPSCRLFHSYRTGRVAGCSPTNPPRRLTGSSMSSDIPSRSCCCSSASSTVEWS